MSRRCRLEWNATTRRWRRKRRRGRSATFRRTTRPAISPTLITHDDSPPVSITTMGREGHSVPQIAIFHTQSLRRASSSYVVQLTCRTNE
jgi:hypothetical protein